MNSHSDDQVDDKSVDNNIDYGSLLAEARKAKNYTTDEVSEHLKIPARTIVALEANDSESLPAATFTRGYIRAYAKFLGMPEDKVLDSYNRSVPQDIDTDLKPRSKLPGEANSQSPLIKAITLLLIVALITAIGVGGFQYYQKKAGVLEDALDTQQQNFTGNSLDDPGSHRLAIQQKAVLFDDGTLLVDGAVVEAEPVEAGSRLETTDTDVVEVKAEAAAAVVKTGADVDRSEDIIEIIAENGSWVEVRDANKSRLLYNMLPAGGSRELTGRAPFSVTMGNARTTRVIVNGIEVDVSDYIRSSNTAIFKVSTQGQDVIFH